MKEVVVSFGERSTDYSYVCPEHRAVIVGSKVTVLTDRGQIVVTVVAVHREVREITKARGFTLATIQPRTLQEMLNGCP